MIIIFQKYPWSSLDIASYWINYHAEHVHQFINYDKLQALIYYTYIWYLVFENNYFNEAHLNEICQNHFMAHQNLFKDPFIKQQYQEYQHRNIMFYQNLNHPKPTEAIQNVFDEVAKGYSDKYTSAQLRNLISNEKPYQDAIHHQNSQLDVAYAYKYYRQLLETGIAEDD